MSTDSDSYSLDLSNQFLIAMPGMNDPNFDHSLIYICHHDEEGAMGLVVNRETDATLSELLEQVSIEAPQDLSSKVLYGGPVRTEQGFILHSTEDSKFEKSDQISEQLSLSGSLEILQAIADNAGPEQYIVSLGYAGWGAKQLETEIQNNSWLTAPAEPSILFECPCEERWNKAVSLLGFDPSTLQSTAGHA